MKYLLRGLGRIGGYLLRGLSLPSIDVDAQNVTTRLTITGTSQHRMVVEGQSAQRLSVDGTSRQRHTIEGSSR